MPSPINFVRIINCDYYMSHPVEGFDVMYSEFRSSTVFQVPIIRVFGTTNTGKKMCLHIHGVFPYLYIPYDGGGDSNSLMYQIASNLDRAINISFGQTSSTNQHVYKVTLVSGIPFYGYHPREHQFFKIYLYNPNLVRKVSGLVQNDAVLGKIYQPHEVHINFVLQFMIDYNLHGMSNISLSKIEFRQADGRIARVSCCEVEGDALSENILNRSEVSTGNLAVNPGIAALWDDEKQRRRDKNQDSLIGTCLTLIDNKAPPTNSHLMFQKALKTRLDQTESDSSPEIDLSISVYPAETPNDTNLCNASVVDIHSPFSQNPNDSLSDLNNTLDVTFDEDGLNLLNVLQQLEIDGHEVVEEDSILSQVSKQYNDEEFDLSLPLEALTTPMKVALDELDESSDSLDKTLVPQLDGNIDESSSDEDLLNSMKKSGQKKKTSKYRALPIIIKSPTKSDVKKNEGDKAKRKLKFKNNVTLTEETLSCNYKRRKKLIVEKENIVNLHNGNSNKKYLIEDFSEVVVKGDVINDKQEEIRVDEIREKEQSTPEHQESSKFIKINELNDFRDKIEESPPSEFSSSSSESICPYQKIISIPDREVSRENDSILFLDKGDDNVVSQETLKSQSSSSSLDVITPYQRVIESHLDDSEQKPTSVNLTAAELYDIQFNFRPKEGCSTVLTQDAISSKSIFSSSLSDDVLSGKSPTEICLVTPKFRAPPSKIDVVNSLENLGIPNIRNQVPFYSRLEDVTGNIEIGYSVLKINARTSCALPEFKTKFSGIDEHRRSLMPPSIKFNQDTVKQIILSYCGPSDCLIRPVKEPPTRDSVRNWKKITTKQDARPDGIPKKASVFVPKSPGNSDESDENLELSFSLPSSISQQQKFNNTGQITGVSLNNTYGFKMVSPNFQKVKAVLMNQFLTVLVVELHVQTRPNLRPDPQFDSIRAIFYSILNEDQEGSSTFKGMIAVNSLPVEKNVVDIAKGTGIDCNISLVGSENELIDEFARFVSRWDPDIVAGYEIEMLSWGYLIERSYVLGINLPPLLSRIKGETIKQNDADFGDSTQKIIGRIVLDVWRLMRHEVALQSYTFESILYHILHQRVPKYTFDELTLWWDHRSSIYRHRTADYYLTRVEGILKLLDKLDLIGRTSELARLFGIQFYEVLSRGSQFRVESMMLRLAKPLNYIPVSPNVQQRAHMKAPEFLPLILEPESKFYVDPVIVLDFQSLYPSMMMAYNYCFSTCLGKVEHLGGDSPFEFGATHLKVSKKFVRKLLEKDCLNFSPCGVAFVKSHIRDGILPRMLREIIDTRLMVKDSMKANRNDETLQKVLHSRQLGLKLIANVTYGYTAANFSGRMPAVELGDSVVSKGRETLQRAIAMVENTKEWGARVVYGDTDSLFVLVQGKTRTEAFEIGRKIANAITDDNPNPVKLKLEKIYQPCILQTKKRYVGYMYESPEQQEPTYDAKGIETVRRDSCPAVPKMLEKCVRLLFETKDVSLVKQYVLKQFHKLFAGRVSLQDLTFAKEYRGVKGYRPGACVPALELARKWTAIDVRNEPRSGERVPYVIAHGPPGLPLIRMVHSPHEFINNPSLRPNILYYITKVIIPPINRCFNLIGADLHVWFNQMPRKQFTYLPTSSPGKKSVISHYFATNNCPACGRQTQSTFCDNCDQQPQRTVLALMEKVRIWERSYFDVKLICQSCTGIDEGANCISLDCPVMYRLNQTNKDLQQAKYVRELLKDF